MKLLQQISVQPASTVVGTETDDITTTASGKSLQFFRLAVGVVSSCSGTPPAGLSGNTWRTRISARANSYIPLQAPTVYWLAETVRRRPRSARTVCPCQELPEHIAPCWDACLRSLCQPYRSGPHVRRPWPALSATSRALYHLCSHSVPTQLWCPRVLERACSDGGFHLLVVHSSIRSYFERLSHSRLAS